MKNAEEIVSFAMHYNKTYEYIVLYVAKLF